MTHAQLIAELSDLKRRFENTVRIGVIAETDYAEARVRVAIGSLHTTWLPWLTSRAGRDRTWHAPEVGEQVVVISPSGDLAQGVVLAAIFYNEYPANAAQPTVHRTIYADGAVIEYDRAAGKLSASGLRSAAITASGDILLKAAAITLDGPVTTTATLQSAGDISDLNSAHGSLDSLRQAYNAHTHICSGPGGVSGLTGTPIP